MDITIKRINSGLLLSEWKEAFIKRNKHRPDAYYERCFAENSSGVRISLAAYLDGEFAGCAHLKFESDYLYFKENKIPEINDLNVFKEYRRKGIANMLIEKFEMLVVPVFARIGIGVGLYKNYGAAQRIYCKRNYVPDGNGIMYQNQEVKPGEQVRVDDDLNLYFVKELGLGRTKLE